MPAVVQTAPEFLDDFLKKATQAKNRIWLQSMVFESGEMMDRLVPLLVSKAKEGVDVCFEIDWVARRFVHGHLPLLPILDSAERRYNRELHAKNWAVRTYLIEQGVRFIEVNQATTVSLIFPMFRRNHVKLFLIDNDYGWVGGVNLLDRAFSCQDFMVRFDSSLECQVLQAQFHRINQLRGNKNLATPLNSTDVLLSDVGKIGNSLIYQRALELINVAKSEICFVSQFVPEGRVREALMIASQRGVRVEIVNSFASARQHWSSAHKAAYRIFIRSLAGHPSIAFRHSKDRIHAKLLITDSSTALFGSHNLVDTGVLMGTEEIAVVTTSPKLVHQLTEFKNSLT